MFHRVGKAAYKANLDNTLALDKYFGHPHRNFKTIHIAGTNGKGSVSHCLASVLQTAGYKTGLYTSPHLKDFRERIRINGISIPENDVVKFIENHAQILNKIQPSFFEMTVAMAFDYFTTQKVDIAIIEVGLGGRLDSTNIITPEISVITNISFDHTELLGNTLTKIAIEKAGIIKPGIPVVIGETENETKPVFLKIAKENNSEIQFADKEFQPEFLFSKSNNHQSFKIKKNNNVFIENLYLDLLGQYQSKNISTILCTLDKLNKNGFVISNSDILSGLENAAKNTGLMGRWQILHTNPLTICDTGHNTAGIAFVTNQIKQTKYKKLHFVLGTVNDKDIDNILELLPTDAIYYFTKANIPRALDENILSAKASVYNLKGNSYPSVKIAYDAAKDIADKDDLIFIGGSTFVVAEVL